MKLTAERGWSYYDVAAMVGMSPSSLYKYCTQFIMPGVDTLAALADVFDMTMDELIGRNVKEGQFFSYADDVQRLPFYHSKMRCQTNITDIFTTANCPKAGKILAVWGTCFAKSVGKLITILLMLERWNGMANCDINIGWKTRPCVVIEPTGEDGRTLWHAWNPNPNKNHVCGLVENEFGQMYEVDAEKIIFLDSRKHFDQYNWESLKDELIERIKDRRG